MWKHPRNRTITLYVELSWNPFLFSAITYVVPIQKPPIEHCIKYSDHGRSLLKFYVRNIVPPLLIGDPKFPQMNRGGGGGRGAGRDETHKKLPLSTRLFLVQPLSTSLYITCTYYR